MKYSFKDLKFIKIDVKSIAARIYFSNGYGASVISGPLSYGGDKGLYELAVIYNDRIVYDTPITNDTVGFLTEDDVSAYFHKIAALPSRTHYEVN